MKVKRMTEYGSKKWGIYKGDLLIEGGFSSKEAAEDYLNKEYGDYNQK